MIKFTAKIKPIGKPRMTQSDKWKQRKCVVEYRAFADELRIAAPPQLPANPLFLIVKAFIPMPDSWSKKNKLFFRGTHHRQKPDADNILKAVADALFNEDSCIWGMHVEKLWCEAGAERLEIEVE